MQWESSSTFTSDPEISVHLTDIWPLFEVLDAAGSRKLLKELVATGGIEPPTLGL